MLDWLKTILGDSYTEEIDKAVSAEIGKAFVARADFNSKNDELKAAQKTITGLQEAASKFDGVDIEGLQKQLKDAQTDYEKQLAAVRLNSAIDLELQKSKARNLTAARSMLNMDGISLNESGQLVGLSDQLANLQKDNGWLFEAAETINTGAEHGTPITPEIDGVTAAFQRLNPGLKI